MHAYCVYCLELSNNTKIKTGQRPKTFSLDHQRMVFEDEVKVISWTDADSCSGYQLNSSECDNTPILSWDQNIIQGNSVPIPSTSLVDANNISLFFQLNAVNRHTSITCQEILPQFVIEKNGRYKMTS